MRPLEPTLKSKRCRSIQPTTLQKLCWGGGVEKRERDRERERERKREREPCKDIGLEDERS